MAFGGFGGVAFGGAHGFGAAAQAAPAAAADAVDRDLNVPLHPGADTISAINFSPSIPGQYFLAYSSWDGKVVVNRVDRAPNGAPTGAAAVATLDLQMPVLDFKYTPDGSSICAVGCNKKAVLWNLQTNATTDIGAHDAPIKSVHWCARHNMFATGGWDSTLRYFDPRSPREVAKVPLPAKLHAMDVLDDIMVLGTADKKFHIFNLSGNPTAPIQSVDSPLKMHTRCLRICADRQFYLAASPEGRCAIRCTDPSKDNTEIPGSNPKKTYGFAFKCHRDNSLIYPVNAVDAYPNPDFHSVFATAGGDGVVCFWDREKRARTREMKVTSLYAQPGQAAPQVPVTDVRWNPDGDLFAYAMGYDWSKGGEHYNPAAMPPSLWIHAVNKETDLKKKA